MSMDFGSAGATLGANTFTGLQTIAQAAANTGLLALGGYVLNSTTAASMIVGTGTLNTSAVIDVVKFSITDAAHGAGSNFIRLQGGAGGATDVFKVDMSGNITAPALNGIAGSQLSIGAQSGQNIALAGAQIFLSSPGFTPSWSILTSSGLFSPWVDNTYDIGTPANRVRNGFFGTTIRTSAVTVSALPAAAAAGAGARSFVSDATATLSAGIGAAVAGSGTNNVPVVSDGTNWRIG